VAIGEERRFQDVKDALHTREDSSNLIATVASSASIILLGAFISVPTDNLNFTRYGITIEWAGFLFPLIGEVYRELTTLTIDAADLDDLKKLIGTSYSELNRNKSNTTGI